MNVQDTIIASTDSKKLGRYALEASWKVLFLDGLNYAKVIQLIHIVENIGSTLLHVLICLIVREFSFAISKAE